MSHLARSAPRRIRAAALVLATSLVAIPPSPARACGCLAPPDPTHPVVQAGERILFSSTGSQVTAYIQLQYSGDAAEFGWLLPLPSLPTLELGTEELFDALLRTTQSRFVVESTFPDGCFDRFQGGGSSDLAAAAAPDLGAPADAGQQPPSPVVIQASIGPFDYAVLKADQKGPMLDWLAQNRYFVPAGTDGVVTPYIHAGAYFLALKLRSGQSTGDLQPVIVKYPSDLPMIPIILTSVAAQKDMGIQVWLLGRARAIPRNYYHTVVDDAALDWVGQRGYKDLITRAVADAPGKHSFVTEYAGSSSVMRGILDYQGRFGDLAALRLIKDAGAYTGYLKQNGYPFSSGPLVAILQKYLPMPMELVGQGISPAQYYYNLSLYERIYPDLFQHVSLAFDPVALTAEINAKVIQPTLATGKLFVDHPYLTQLYTTLSPADMTADPVFSENPDLPDVSNRRTASLGFHCARERNRYDYATLATPEGFVMRYPSGAAPDWISQLPASLRTEMLRESGPPQVIRDRRFEIDASLAQLFSEHPVGASDASAAAGSCAVGQAPIRPRRLGLLGIGGLFALVAAASLRRRRRAR